MTRTRHRALGIVLVGAAIGGCGKPEATPKSPPTPTTTRINRPVSPEMVTTTKPVVSKRPANHQGMTFVAEWHHIAVGKTTMHRSPAEFRADLERLDRLNFRPVTARDWLAGKMDLGKGASPVVMTFDDANPDQFRLLEDGSVDPNCAVGIWMDFAKDHPDFPVKGTFFVLPTMWGQPKWVGKKLEMLRAWGCEVANHTIAHVPLRHQTDARVRLEIGDAALALEKFGEKGPFTLAYPLGSTPKDLSPLKGFDWKGEKVVTSAAFLVGANPAPAPTSKKFDRYRIPRIQATKGVCGLDYWLDEFEKGHVKPYVE